MKRNNMKKIASFTIDHLKLLPGVYVSRLDNYDGCLITTFDVRMMRPNFEPVMNTAEIHAIEHLGATFLRNHPQFGRQVVYFGPMGCRTGFYLLLAGEHTSRQILPLIRDLFEYISSFEGEIPGASASDCGNFRDMNLPMAKFLAQKFINDVISGINENQLVYPK